MPIINTTYLILSYLILSYLHTFSIAERKKKQWTDQCNDIKCQRMNVNF